MLPVPKVLVSTPEPMSAYVTVMLVVEALAWATVMLGADVSVAVGGVRSPVAKAPMFGLPFGLPHGVPLKSTVGAPVGVPVAMAGEPDWRCRSPAAGFWYFGSALILPIPLAPPAMSL